MLIPLTDQYPWIAALAYRIEPDNQIRIMCAGSLISQRHVLTTAHCISQSLAFVRLGEHDLSSNTDGANPIDVNVARVTVHEDYVANIILNDIAMLTLDRLVPINGDHPLYMFLLFHLVRDGSYLLVLLNCMYQTIKFD